jgi:hypothetical protein
MTVSIVPRLTRALRPCAHSGSRSSTQARSNDASDGGATTTAGATATGATAGGVTVGEADSARPGCSGNQPPVGEATVGPAGARELPGSRSSESRVAISAAASGRPVRVGIRRR